MPLKLPVRSFALTVAVVLTGGCASLSDPAVRLARCVERQSKSLDRSANDHSSAPCDLQTGGGYVVVLHPQGALSEEELIQAGVPKSLVRSLQDSRMGEYEQVLVRPLEAASPVSSTTYQHRFVQIPRLLVIEKGKPEAVLIELVKTQDGIEIAALR